MLLTRVITAVILLVILVSTLVWGGDLGWQAFVGVMLAAAFWEWARLGGLKNGPSLAYGVVGLAILGAALFTFNFDSLGFPVMAIAAVFWIVLVPRVLRQHELGVLAKPQIFLPLGLMVMAGAGVALILAKSHGIVFLLSAMAICWVADIFAYVFGKLFGRRKLAIHISPGKSWEGAMGGTACVLVLSWLVVWAAPSNPFLQETWQFAAYSRWHPVWFTLWLVVLSAYSIVGDLFESLLKRRVGFKDSSQLLPGHGGVLDRIDAQLPVLPLAMLLVQSSGA